jgi:hypothetical protein
VVHRQQPPVFISEFPAALGADHSVDFQGAFTVGLIWLHVAKSFLYGPVDFYLLYLWALIYAFNTSLIRFR